MVRNKNDANLYISTITGKGKATFNEAILPNKLG